MEAIAKSAALIAAAGSGERLGRGPKAFLELAGKTLLERVVEATAPAVDEVIVAVPDGREEQARRLVPAATVIEGGSSRQESVLALIGATRAQVVLVHDVARPFLERAVTDRVLEAARRCGAATAARTVPDTVVDGSNGMVLDRDRLRTVQTPQAFRRDLLLEAHAAAATVGREGTDDASLVRALGHPVELVAGSPWLFKLTAPEDLGFASALAAAWDALMAEP
ncbi:MAG TPA: 2-C-methyl-D-erythritol 4-phosphate cytidylyltransferase [Trueperaceae bacterium]